MNIEPLANRPREISVTEPLTLACARAKLLLFQPFDIGKWFTIGFCAWLAGLGESGGGFNYHGPSFSHHYNNTQPWDQMRHSYAAARDYTLANLAWLVPVVVLVFLLVLGLGFLFLWLNSRGKFMFLHCVALNRSEIVEPWERYAASANSLFWFRAVLCLVGMVVSIPLLIVMGFLMVGMFMAGEADAPRLFATVGIGAVWFLLVLVLTLIHKFLADFVVPIMFLRGGACLAGWREFSRLLTAHSGSFVLYILAQIVLAIAIGILVVLIFVVTCCIACCVVSLPYLGTVLLLPILVFKRAYSLYFFAQFGPAYDVFPPPVPPPVAVPPPGLQPL